MVDCFWSFYNQRSQARYDGFKTVQARGFVTAIPADQAADWIVWKEGNPDWLPLTQFTELFGEDGEYTFAAESEFNLQGEEDFQTDPNYDMIGENHNTFTNTKSLAALKPDAEKDPSKKVEETKTDLVGGIVPEDVYIDVSTLQLDTGKLPELPRPDLRKSGRQKRVLEAEVDYGGKQKLKTKTIDISMGGVLLELHLPADAKKNVKMKLSRGEQKLEVIAQNILDKNGFPSRRYKFLDVNQPELLRTWVLV